jgi:NTE family protein
MAERLIGASSMDSRSQATRVALVLTGGGARAAYQVGVLQAIAKILPKSRATPFPILCGTSAGAINAAALAADAPDFRKAVNRLLAVWRNFHAHHVYRSDLPEVIATGVRWLAALMVGGLGRGNPVSLLDNAPLRALLQHAIDFQNIDRSIADGTLDALSVAASSYSTGQSVTFFHSSHGIEPWTRVRRVGVPGKIRADHLLASAAIPFIFPAVRVGRDYLGDGSMRQLAPVSPALHLGAGRVVVVAVGRSGQSRERAKTPEHPSLAQIAGHVLNSIFLNTVESDLERLEGTNATLSAVPSHVVQNHGTKVRRVEALLISPSEDVEAIALKHAHELPGAIRFLLRGVGGLRESGSNVLSYVLFEKGFCRELIRLGYRDAVERRNELSAILQCGESQASGASAGDAASRTEHAAIRGGIRSTT